jgi:hypothetical protein
MKAECMVIWANKEVFCCRKHAGEITAVGAAMGVSVLVYKNDTDAECSNCANEKVKENSDEGTSE